MPKTLGDTFLYKKGVDFNRAIIKFITKAQRIKTNSNEFADVIYNVKIRRISDALTKILISPNVVLGTIDTPLPKTLRAFVAKDVLDNNKPKMFIDGSQFIKYDKNYDTYSCTDVSWLICYIVSGMVNFVYRQLLEKLTLNSSVLLDGCNCYVRLFSYIIDRIYKITSVQQVKARIDYTLALFYYHSLLGRDFKSESQFKTTKNYAVKVTGIDDRDADTVNVMLQPTDFEDLEKFVEALKRLFPSLVDINVNIILNMWMSAFGPGTYFGIEFFPAFSQILTNAYIGGYIDNQNMIEKLTSPSMVAYVKAILKIGESVA